MIFHHILPTILIMMLGAKAHNYDTYGLLRAAHFHNPPQIFVYRGIFIILSQIFLYVSNK